MSHSLLNMAKQQCVIFWTNCHVYVYCVQN